MYIDEKTLHSVSMRIHQSLTNSGIEDAKRKGEFAKACGLESIAEHGSFCAMVAVHKDLPEVVIKVVPNYDMFLTFAQDVMSGVINHPMFPKIYGITKVGDHSIITIERIPFDIQDNDDDFIDMVHTLDLSIDSGAVSLDDEEHESFIHVCREFLSRNLSVKPDFHIGNFMVREDMTLCCVDPFWSSQRTKEG